MSKVIFLCAATFAVAAAVPATAAIITFDDLASDTIQNFASVTTNGYTFTSGLSNGTFTVWARDSDFNADPGAATLSNGFPGTSTTIAKTDGGAFTFTGIDLANVYNNFGGGGLAYAVDFSFIDVLGASSTASVIVDGEPGLESFDFALGPLMSVTFTPVGNRFDNFFIQFDNVRVDELAAVPEPASWAMMIAGFGLVGGAMRHRRQPDGLAA